MVTGEGKTLVATLPAYLNALTGKGVHVVTVNDYLARRDMEWMGPLYMSLGLTVGAIQSNMEPDQRQRPTSATSPTARTTSSDSTTSATTCARAPKGDTAIPKHQQAQGPLHYAIIDEVDNILIDEARTPLIISGPAHDDVTRYARADRIARQLQKGRPFRGQREGALGPPDRRGRPPRRESWPGVESFYTAGNMEWPHLIDNSLKAHHLYKRDVNYVVRINEIVIVDEFTGRLMPGRNWSDGLHQAVEAKEGVPHQGREPDAGHDHAAELLQAVRQDLAGMTGTAMTEASEFWKIYKLDVIAIPTNRPCSEQPRRHLPHGARKSTTPSPTKSSGSTSGMCSSRPGIEELMGRSKRKKRIELEFQPKGMKQDGVGAQGQDRRDPTRGRPILVGTVSIERSEQSPPC